MLLAQHFYSPVHAAARVLALKEANCPALPARGKELHWWPLEGGGLGFPVHHQLPELTQTHVHRVGDAIQLSHPHLSPSPPAFNLSQHQGLFQ